MKPLTLEQRKKKLEQWRKMLTPLGFSVDDNFRAFMYDTDIRLDVSALEMTEKNFIYVVYKLGVEHGKKELQYDLTELLGLKNGQTD